MLAAMPEHLHADAAQRYASHAPVLYERLASLYGGRDDFQSWFGNLMEAVGRLYGARAPALLQLDTEGAARPDGFASQRMLGYSAYVQRFGGTLRGVAAHIPHLRELGVTYLHLLPFLRVRCHDNIGWNLLRGEAGQDGGDAAQADSEAGAHLQLLRRRRRQRLPELGRACRPRQQRHGRRAGRPRARRRLLLHGLALCFGALPVLHMGDELGRLNDYSFLSRPERAIDSRWPQRPDFDDTLLAQRRDGASGSVALQPWAMLWLELAM